MPAELEGKTTLVTGANTGIGKEIARGLARSGSTVIFACRSQERGQAALDELRQDTGNDNLELQLVDLDSQASIRALASRVLERHEALHVLVNNAGIYPEARALSPDGLERTWATNVIAYHLLAQLLLPRLIASAPARIVNVASTAAGGLDMDDLQFETRRFGGISAYKQSKQANRMLSWALHRRVASQGVSVNVAHPGPVATELARTQKGLWGVLNRFAFRVFGRSPSDGADTALWLATNPDLEGKSGLFWAKRRERRCEFANERQEEALWSVVESQILPVA